MNPKVIDKSRFTVDDEDTKKFSYEMVFLPKKEEKDVDLVQAIERNNLEWNHKLSEEKQKSIKKGYDSGFEDGLTEARRTISEQLQPLEVAFDDLSSRMEIWKEQLAPDVEKLVFLLAEKVIGIPVQNEELSQKISQEIQQQLEVLVDQQQCIISVSDTDYESVISFVELRPDSKNIQVTRDVNLKPGEYQIQTNFEKIERFFKKRMDDFAKQSGLDHQL